jgi:hypothetical protein
MADLPKLKFSSLTRTSLGTPSQWETTNDDGTKIVCHFRIGRLKIFVNGEEVLETSKDEWDISGYLSDEDLIKLLKKHDMLIE